jgi:transketolase
VRFSRGQSLELRSGEDVAILSTGAILDVACAAADLLAGDGVRVTVRSFPWLDPLDTEAIQAVARRCAAVVTLEEHSIVGGLGSAVAEVLAESPVAAPLARIALPVEPSSVVGDQSYLRSVYGLDPAAVARRVLKHLEESSGLARQVR